MGMFDTIKCKYKLPMPENPKGYSGSDDFQSKDLDCSLSYYEIREDGSLWREDVESEWVAGNPKAKSFLDRLGHPKRISSKWVQVFDQKQVSIYDYLQGEGEYDYSIEYNLNFENGILKEANLHQFEAKDNAERKRREAIFKEQMRKDMEFRKTFRFRLICNPWNIFIRFVFNYLNKIVNSIQSNMFKIERMLKL